jgi:hypothetical protein
VADSLAHQRVVEVVVDAENNGVALAAQVAKRLENVETGRLLAFNEQAGVVDSFETEIGQLANRINVRRRVFQSHNSNIQHIKI